MTPKRDHISVLIASANTMAGELLASVLNRQSYCRVVATGTTVEEVLEAVASVTVNVALISASLSDGTLSGFRALRLMLDRDPAVKAVLLLDSPDPNLVVDAFRTGAKGVFCHSESGIKALCLCVDRVHAGQIWANSSELTHVLEAFTRLAPIRVVNADGMRLLTKREEDVVRLLAEGLQNREIAQELNLSEHTIKNHLFHIFDKLGVSSRVELILYAVSSSNRLPIARVESDEHEDETGNVTPAVADPYQGQPESRVKQCGNDFLLPDMERIRDVRPHSQIGRSISANARTRFST
jgi:DNA-binding NarL/FixJ family response regulator